MVILGLTGSIGMGKSTVAGLFEERGVPVFDADRCVHELYQKEAVAAIEAAFPGVSDANGVDRGRLSKRLLRDTTHFKTLEAIVHPLVQDRRQAFARAWMEKTAELIVFDIPLLYEISAESHVDAVVLVSAPFEVQKQRVLARPGMDEDKFNVIFSRQIADSEKRKRCDFLIETHKGTKHTRTALEDVIKQAKTLPPRAINALV